MDNILIQLLIIGLIVYLLTNSKELPNNILNNVLEDTKETFQKKENLENEVELNDVLLDGPVPQKSNELIKRMTLEEATKDSEYIHDIYDKMLGVIDHGITDEELERIQGNLYIEKVENTEPIFYNPVYSSFDKSYYNPTKNLNNTNTNVQPYNVLTERTVNFLNNKKFGIVNNPDGLPNNIVYKEQKSNTFQFPK